MKERKAPWQRSPASQRRRGNKHMLRYYRYWLGLHDLPDAIRKDIHTLMAQIKADDELDYQLMSRVGKALTRKLTITFTWKLRM